MHCLIVLALAAVATAAPQYYNSIAIPTVLPDGHLADTPEVAAAKAFHFAEHARALAGAPSALASPAAIATVPTSTFIHTDTPRYYASPVITPDGFVTDTAEVSKAKALHYAAHAAAVGAPVDPYLNYLSLYA